MTASPSISSSILWRETELLAIAHKNHWHLHYNQEIDSTNTQLAHLAKHENIHRHAWLADLQLQGRGRQGKTWHAQAGHTFMCSIGWQVPLPLHQVARGSSLLIGLTLVQVLNTFGIQAHVKWPNDLFLQGKKLAGILVEVAHHNAHHTTLIIGMGLNWITPALPSLEDSATTLSPSIGLTEALPSFSEKERYVFFDRLLIQLNHNLTLFGEDGFASFRYDWNQSHIWAVGTPVSWKEHDQTYEGFLDTLDEHGCLWVTQHNGHRVPLGEHAYTLRLKKDFV
ncbi:MAG: biotin--[acetyl-CoA-carboxylase] ligase [Pseudomonadota bacterium]